MEQWNKRVAYIDIRQRLLDHLKEAAFYSPKDLESASHALDSMQETLKRGEESHSPHLLKLLRHRLDTCRQLLSDLQSSLADLSPELTPTYERLVSILRSISAANTRQKVPLLFHHLGMSGTYRTASSQKARFKASRINSARFRLRWLTASL